jgi:murein DD-endopeptidase MepM/ murein hydrolase activator NlpD
MPERTNTIIVVPHGQAKLIKFSFSTRRAVMLGVGALTALILAFVALAYTGAAVSRRADVRRLSRENRELGDVNRQLARTIAEVQGRLDQFEERTARLALAAGLRSDAFDQAQDVGGSNVVGTGGAYDRLPGTPERLLLQGQWVEQQIGLIQRHLETRDRMLASTPTIAPAVGLITGGFGRRLDPITGRPAFHSGIDISAVRGLPVKAPADGVVVFAGHDSGLGRTVRISHGFGFTTVYGHLDRIDVEPGEEVERGDVVGRLGNSGRSTGPHLHYEVHADGQAVNPLNYILDAY